MSIKSELINNLSCKICNKEYSSRSSLCNHNKKFHNTKTNNCNKNCNSYKNNWI